MKSRLEGGIGGVCHTPLFWAPDTPDHGHVVTDCRNAADHAVYARFDLGAVAR